jgi:hypothetical protein
MRATARNFFLRSVRRAKYPSEGSPRYRALQKKDNKTAPRFPSTAAFSGKRRLLTRGSGEVSAVSNDAPFVRAPNVSGVSQVGDHRVDFERAKPDRACARTLKNSPGFARLRLAMKMIVDVGT